MVGHVVGYTANAAIGVSWQIFLVVIVFIASLFTGMGVLVARFAGANDHERVDRTVYQAFLVAIVLAVGIMAPVGYFAAPSLLQLVNATPDVSAQALPYLRTMFLFSIGMLLFFMLGGALRAAGDARTPLRLGVVMTVLNIGLNVVLIGGLGPIPALGTFGSALGTVIASSTVSAVALWMILSGRMVLHFPRHMSWAPDWTIIRQLFKFGLPAGLQGVAMNVAGVLMLRFIGSLEHSAEAQAAYAVGYAVCEGPLGPCSKPSPEPILVSSESAAGPGHCVLVEKDGRTWMVHHAWPPESVGSTLPGRTMWLTEVTWSDGVPVLDGPRATVDVVP